MIRGCGQCWGLTLPGAPLNWRGDRTSSKGLTALAWVPAACFSLVQGERHTPFPPCPAHCYRSNCHHQPCNKQSSKEAAALPRGWRARPRFGGVTGRCWGPSGMAISAREPLSSMRKGPAWTQTSAPSAGCGLRASPRGQTPEQFLVPQRKLRLPGWAWLTGFLEKRRALAARVDPMAGAPRPVNHLGAHPRLLFVCLLPGAELVPGAHSSEFIPWQRGTDLAHGFVEKASRWAALLPGCPGLAPTSLLPSCRSLEIPIASSCGSCHAPTPRVCL